MVILLLSSDNLNFNFTLSFGYSFIMIVTIPTYGKKPLALPTTSLGVSHS
jgi:hypothetical protein